VLALDTGSLERKRHRCKSIGRRVAIPFMRFLQLAGRGLRIALRLPAGKSEHRAILIKFSLQHKYFCKLRCKTSVS